MSRKIAKIVTFALFSAISAQSAAADATSTIRNLMGDRGLTRSAHIAMPTPGVSRTPMIRSDANAMMRSMLGNDAWPMRMERHAFGDLPRAIAPRLRSFDYGVAMRTDRDRCGTEPNRVTIHRFGWGGGVTSIVQRSCGGYHGVSTFRLGTAMLSPHRIFSFGNRALINSELGAWRLPARILLR